MIVLKTTGELDLMKQAGSIAAGALQAGLDAVKPGVSTAQINQVVHSYITKRGAKPSFLGYGGFPAAACISVGSEVIHGIPSPKRIISEGELVSIDVGALYKGYHGDTAATTVAGAAAADAAKLMEVTAECLRRAISVAIVGNRIGDISYAVQQHAEENGMGVVRQFVGHGIGQKLHETPEVPNYGTPGRGTRLAAGMTIAIEPMINFGTHNVKVLADQWTVVTTDASLSAHFEHTVAITEAGPVILTLA